MLCDDARPRAFASQSRSRSVSRSLMDRVRLGELEPRDEPSDAGVICGE